MPYGLHFKERGEDGFITAEVDDFYDDQTISGFMRWTRSQNLGIHLVDARTIKTTMLAVVLLLHWMIYTEQRLEKREEKEEGEGMI